MFARASAATAVSYPPERRLSAAQLASYLDRRAFAVLGSTRGNGMLHSAMSVFVRRVVTFWLPTMAKTVRERNLRVTPWLTMVIAEGDHPAHIAVIVEGPAEFAAPSQLPEDVQAVVIVNCVSIWICLTAERLLYYANENAQP